MRRFSSIAGSHPAMKMFVLGSVFGMLLASCSNDEGQGGSASISGNITEVFFTEDFSDSIYQQPAADEDVFILFGDEEAPGDRVSTGLNGDFLFEYLYPGTYHIYFQSDDSTEFPDDGWSELLTVKLGSGEDKDVGDLYRLNTLDIDEGAAMITGTVERVKYSKESFCPNLVTEYVDFAHEHEIYLRYGEKEGYDERVRTAYDGTFAFRNLIPGEYTVFLFSEDVCGNAQHVVLTYKVSITEFEQHTDLGTITIEAI